MAPLQKAGDSGGQEELPASRDLAVLDAPLVRLGLVLFAAHFLVEGLHALSRGGPGLGIPLSAAALWYLASAWRGRSRAGCGPVPEAHGETSLPDPPSRRLAWLTLGLACFAGAAALIVPAGGSPPTLDLASAALLVGIGLTLVLQAATGATRRLGPRPDLERIPGPDPAAPRHDGTGHA